jgi:hypothetical protein
VAFFLGDKALKPGDARQIGILSWSIAIAALMIIGAAVSGTHRD